MSDRVTLAVSASTGTYACALHAANGTIHVAVEPRAGVAQAAARVCDVAGVRPAAIDRLLLDLGPGSYTGLRVAVAFAATLRAFDGVPVLTATSLELRALCAWVRYDVPDDSVVRAILDGRRGRFHHAAVRLQNGSVHVVAPPRASTLAELADAVADDEWLLTETPPPPALADLAAARGLGLHAHAFDAATLVRTLLDDRLAPRPHDGPLEPLYLMGSYVEPA